MAALAEAGFRAVAPDLRGYGDSDRPENIGRHTMLDHVGNLVNLLDALEIHQVVIAGCNMGAIVAWQAVLLRPDRFRGIVTLGSPLGKAPLPLTTSLP